MQITHQIWSYSYRMCLQVDVIYEVNVILALNHVIILRNYMNINYLESDDIKFWVLWKNRLFKNISGFKVNGQLMQHAQIKSKFRFKFIYVYMSMHVLKNILHFNSFLYVFMINHH